MSNTPALTPEVRERLLQGLRLGNYINTTLAACGVSKQQFCLWMREGRKGKAPYDVLAREVTEALAIAEMRDLATIQKASAEQWQAAAWRLERRYPKRWGRRAAVDRVAVTVAPPGASILDLPSRMPPEAVRSVIATLLEHETDAGRRAELERVKRAVEGL